MTRTNVCLAFHWIRDSHRTLWCFTHMLWKWEKKRNLLLCLYSILILIKPRLAIFLLFCQWIIFHELIAYNNRKCEYMRNFAVCGFLLFCYEIKWSLQNLAIIITIKAIQVKITSFVEDESSVKSTAIFPVFDEFFIQERNFIWTLNFLYALRYILRCCWQWIILKFHTIIELCNDHLMS